MKYSNSNIRCISCKQAGYVVTQITVSNEDNTFFKCAKCFKCNYDWKWQIDFADAMEELK